MKGACYTHKKMGYSKKGILIFSVCLFFYFYEFLLQVLPGVLIHPIMNQYGATAVQASLLGAVYFYAYALVQIPAGIILDNVSIRRVITYACLWVTLSTLFFSFSMNLNQIIIARFLTAFGSAFALIGCMKIASNWFESKYFALLSGIILFVGMMGAISGHLPFSMLRNVFSGRTVVFYLALVGMALTTILMLTIRQGPYANVTQLSNKKLFQGIKIIINEWHAWALALFSGFMFAPMISLGTLWGEKYLIDSYHYTNTHAALAVSFMFIGLGLGALLGGVYSNHYGHNKKTLLISAIGSPICLLVYVYVPSDSLNFYCILGFLLGFFTGLSWLAFAMVKALFPKNITATAIAFTNLVNMLICASAQFVVGLLLDVSVKKTYHHVNIYSAKNYEDTFILFPILSLAALLLLFFINGGKNKTAS
jgi:MFS family permease